MLKTVLFVFNFFLKFRLLVLNEKSYLQMIAVGTFMKWNLCANLNIFDWQ